MTSERTRSALSVLALVLGFVLAVALAGAALALSFCGLFGEECSAEEEQTIALLSLASLGVFLLVPVLVAAVRRQARWLLAPVIEVAGIVLLVTLNAWF